MQERRGASIAITNLRKEYGDGADRVVALDGIDLAIAPGEFCCIVGPSGCGKSTLLRILAGLDHATGGSINVDAAGWPVANAMVFQESGLFPWMSVEKNVGFGLMTRGVPTADAAKRVDAALHLVGLTRFRHLYPHQLSGGMRQRGAIARAFVTDPAMLLMDEPFAALDAQNRVILQAELVRVWEETGKTVVYITHSIDEALLLARQEIEDLRLDRDVERGGRLIRDQELRLAGQRYRDRDALAHAAGQLVRILRQPLLGRGNADPRQQFDAALPGLGQIELEMLLDGLDQLGADGQHRIERGHGILEHDGERAAA